MNNMNAYDYYDNIPPGYNPDGEFVGFSKKSEARKKYWQTIPKEKRSAEMSRIAKIRQAKMTAEERLALVKKASKASHEKLSTREDIVEP